MGVIPSHDGCPPLQTIDRDNVISSVPLLHHCRAAITFRSPAHGASCTEICAVADSSTQRDHLGLVTAALLLNGDTFHSLLQPTRVWHRQPQRFQIMVTLIQLNFHQRSLTASSGARVNLFYSYFSVISLLRHADSERRYTSALRCLTVQMRRSKAAHRHRHVFHQRNQIPRRMVHTSKDRSQRPRTHFSVTLGTVFYQLRQLGTCRYADEAARPCRYADEAARGCTGNTWGAPGAQATTPSQYSRRSARYFIRIHAPCVIFSHFLLDFTSAHLPQLQSHRWGGSADQEILPRDSRYPIHPDSCHAG